MRKTTTTPPSPETFEGWTNRATWTVALHINNDRAAQDHAHHLRDNARQSAPGSRQCAEGTWTPAEAVRFTLAESFKDWIGDTVIDEHPGEGSFSGPLRLDLLRGYMAEVDWDEIADSFIEPEAGTEGGDNS